MKTRLIWWFVASVGALIVIGWGELFRADQKILPDASKRSNGHQIQPNKNSEVSQASLKEEPAAIQVTKALTVQRIYSQMDMYPFLMRMHDARQSGSWASGMQLIHICIKAKTLLDSQQPLLFTNGEVKEDIRLEAKNKLEIRCSSLPPGILEQYDPMLNDENAIRYRAAKRFLSNRQFSDKEKTLAAIRELSQQQKLEEAAPILAMTKVWNGEEWDGDDSIFSQMVNAAAELATAEPSNEKDDLRLIYRCYFNARCDYKYGTINEANTPSETARRQKIVQEMADAIRRGDVDRILNIKH